MNKKNNTAAVIGAGPMGLMAAYELLKKGFKVSIHEADDRIGGMSASFDFSGLMLERYYHFVCGPDKPFFELLNEFNLLDKLKWVDTSMGYFYDGKLYKWGDPFSLLRFPKLSFLQKIRYGLFAMAATKKKDWRKYDNILCKDWVTKWIGADAYAKLWQSLFKYKFYQYKDDLSAAWLGTRIKRVGLSRKSLFQESLGYLDGGSDVLLRAMEQRIKSLGGEIILNSKVDEVVSQDKKIIGIKAKGSVEHYDHVVSTVPLPYVSKLVPGLSHNVRQQIDNIKNVGVACVVYKLKSKITDNFWLNVNDKDMQIPGIIEYSNLRPTKEKILYVPYYMPHDHPKWAWADEQFVEEINGYLKRIQPNFSEDWILDKKVSRYAFSQTVCTPNFYEQLPPIKSEIEGFYMADTAYYYPEDRSICESVALAKKIVELIDD